MQERSTWEFLMSLPVSQLDTEKRYDIYHHLHHEERVYENVKLVGLRKIGGEPGTTTFLELETVYGSRMFVWAFGVHLICEHGTKPMFRVFRSWLDPNEGKSTLS